MPKRDCRGGVAGRTVGGNGVQPRCTAQTQQGAPCRSFAVPPRPYCRMHDPERAAEVQMSRAKGGAHASKLRAIAGRRSKLDSPRALLAFTATLIHRTVERELEPDVARCAFYGLSLQRQLVESSELEQRIAALEAQAPARGRRRW